MLRAFFCSIGDHFARAVEFLGPRAITSGHAMFELHDRQRLETERNLWLATTCPNGSPHLVPIWFVWLDDKVYLCTSAGSVKARNVIKNPHVSVALENGDDPVVIQGMAKILDEPSAEVIEAFQRKFDWNIRGDGTYNAVIEITPSRLIL